MDFLNSIYYKSLVALYRLNINSDGRAKNIIVDSIYEGLVIGSNGLNLARLEMALDTATEDWLDYWGTFFGVLREYNESDSMYRKRIIEEILAPKNTIPALKRAAARHVNRHFPKEHLSANDIRIFEPWSQLLKLDSRGVLDGTGRLISYDYWNYSVVDISLPNSNLITPDLIEYLNTIKAGGVKIAFSISPNWDIVVDPIREERDYSIWKKIYREHYIIPEEISEIFSTLAENVSEKLSDTMLGGILDEYGYLDGGQTIYWDGVNRSREVYATGPIRNHLGSAVSNLTDYLKVTWEGLEIGDVIEEEEKICNGGTSREEESIFSILQGPITIQSKMNSLENGGYVPFYVGEMDDKNFYFDRNNLFDYLTFEELYECCQTYEITLEELEMAITNPTARIVTETTKILQKLTIDKMKQTLYEESIQRPIYIVSEPI